jgi:nitroreductase
MLKPAHTSVSIHKLIANRWSGRAYDATKSINHAQVIALLEAARWAPSSCGDQPWRFVVWNKMSDAEGWQKAFGCLDPFNQSWVKDAPLLFLVCADSLFNQDDQPNRWAQYDTGAAAENLCLQAEAMGMMAHQMGGVDPEHARVLAGVPDRYTLMAMVSVGYPAEVTTLDGEVKAREIEPRKRRELGELFYTGIWGKPVA